MKTSGICVSIISENNKPWNVTDFLVIGCKILDFLAQMMEQIDDKFYVKKKKKSVYFVEWS